MSQSSGFFKLLACDVASSVHDASVLVDLTILSGNSFAANPAELGGNDRCGRRGSHRGLRAN